MRTRTRPPNSPAGRDGIVCHPPHPPLWRPSSRGVSSPPTLKDKAVLLPTAHLSGRVGTLQSILEGLPGGGETSMTERPLQRGGLWAPASPGVPCIQAQSLSPNRPPQSPNGKCQDPPPPTHTPHPSPTAICTADSRDVGRLEPQCARLVGQGHCLPVCPSPENWVQRSRQARAEPPERLSTPSVHSPHSSC